MNGESPDKLPPHDDETERALLGCFLYTGTNDYTVESAMLLLDRCRQQFGEFEVFYDLRNREIWKAMVDLRTSPGRFDLITLMTELRARQMLDEVGGITYLGKAQDAAVSPTMLEDYLAIVWERYLARELIQRNARQTKEVMETGELSEARIARIQIEHDQWRALLGRGTVTPKNLCAPKDFQEEYYNQWFNRHEDTFGYELPFAFPLRLRPSATTLLTGTNGSGKSNVLCLMEIIVGRQLEPGKKVVIASMEMPPEVTLWILARQLLGRGRLECNDENTRLIGVALAWLNQRLLIYNFLGITDKRELMDTFEYAAEREQGVFFIIDNMMKVGIPDDDYAAQGQFVQQVCDFDMKRKVHTVVVVHQNKGDGNAKQKVRGSGQLTDAPDNVVKMQRNEEKAEKIEDLGAELKARAITPEMYDEKMRPLRMLWDGKFTLHKQRWAGARQNASKYLYFHQESLQYHEEPNKGAFNFLS